MAGMLERSREKKTEENKTFSCSDLSVHRVKKRVNIYYFWQNATRIK